MLSAIASIGRSSGSCWLMPEHNRLPPQMTSTTCSSMPRALGRESHGQVSSPALTPCDGRKSVVTISIEEETH
jgi:hypothetical protein